MPNKDELLAEAAALGIEGLDDSFKNSAIQGLIDEARAKERGDEPVAEPAPIEIEKSAPVKAVAPVAAAKFTLEQLMPYAESLFGVGRHVLKGAQSAGFIPSGRVTKEQVSHGIDQYMKMPVKEEV